MARRRLPTDRRLWAVALLAALACLSWGAGSAFGEPSAWQLQAARAGGFASHISCWSDSSCATIGMAGTIPEYVQGQLKIRKLPRGHAEIDSISCSGGRCLAFGLSIKKGAPTPLVQWSSRGRWAAPKRFRPPSARRLAGLEIASVSCPAKGDCYALGSYGVKYTTRCPTSSSHATSISVSVCFGYSGTTHLVVLHWNGHVWKVHRRLPLPPAVRRRHRHPALGVGPQRISCSSRRHCVAIGEWLTRSPHKLPFRMHLFAERWDGHRWSARTLPTPPAGPGKFGRLLMLHALSCASQRLCMAVGEMGILKAKLFAILDRDGHWSLAHPLIPSDAKLTSLSSVACGSEERCLVVGGAGRAMARERPLSEVWTPAGWSVLQVPEPSSRGSSVLTGVSCPSADVCEAVGQHIGRGLGHGVFGWFLERYAPRP